MNTISILAIGGAVGLIIGVALVNIATTPIAAQVGMIVAGIAVLMLSFAAIGQMFFAS